MSQIRYIHAADLHIDKPFSGLEQAPNNILARELREAPYIALDNLVQACLQECPDFVVIAGDIYDQEERGIKAQLRIRDACAKINEAGIPVIIAHGNHDPLSSRLVSIQWPKGTFVFGSVPEKKYIEKNGEKIALAHGISHATTREGRNLAELFARDTDFAGFQLGILHCNVDSSVINDRYAPCGLQDLIKANLDAWALGHAHKRHILCEKPLIAYSGNLQGQNSRETGPKGAFLVTCDLDLNDYEWICSAQFIKLSPILWANVEIEMEPAETLDSLYVKINIALKKLIEENQNYRAILASLALTGHTNLDPLLRREGAMAELRDELADTLNFNPPLWVKSVALASAPCQEIMDSADRDDLLGQVFRLCSNLEKNPHNLEQYVTEALSDLYSGRRISGILSPPGDIERQELLNKAQKICQSILEGG